MRDMLLSRLVGTLAAILVCVAPCSVAQAAKPSGGACTSAADFPAFAYRVASSRTSTIYIADATGQCSRALTSGQVPKFSYPVDGIGNKGRVVWLQGQSILAADFTVGSGNTLSGISVRTLLTTAGCCALDLSKDGRTVYFSLSDTTLAKMDVAGTGGPVTVFTSSSPTWFYQIASLNADGTRLFATKTGFGASAGASQLVRIDLDSAPVQETVLRASVPQAGYGASPFWPSADPNSNRIAFHEYVVNSDNCTPLTVTDYDGNELDTAGFSVERYGRDPTWVGGRIVMQRRNPMNGSGACSSTTSLSQVVLESNEESVLLTGHNPDGR